MIKLILLLLVSANLLSLEFEKEYFFTTQTIYSTDIFPDVPTKFEILKIPDGKNQYRIDSRIVGKTFELHGINVDVTNTPVIQFTKQSSINFSSLKQQLSDILRRHYDSIDIEAVTITPRGYLDSLPDNPQGYFDPRVHLNSKGIFYVLDKNGMRRYLDYQVNARLGIYHTSQKVVRKENLNGANAVLQTVVFGSYKDEPLVSLPQFPHRFRTTIKAGTLLTRRNIEEIPLVQKNDKVIVVVKNGAVVVEFGAVATQEGSLYDIITIQKRDGKRSKAKVIGENRVELQ